MAREFRFLGLEIPLQATQRREVARRSRDGHRASGQVAQSRDRFPGGDEGLPDLEVVAGEEQALRRAGGRLHPAGRHQVAASGEQPLDEFQVIARHDHGQVQAVARRELLHQLVLEPEPFTPPEVVRHRRTDGQQPELARRPDRLPVAEFRRLIGDGVVLGQEVVESTPESRISLPHGPGDAARLGKLPELVDLGAGANHHPGGRFVEDRGVDHALFDERLDVERSRFRRDGRPGRIRVVGQQALLVGGPRRNAEDAFRAADHPFPGDGERDGERDPLLAGFGHREGGDRHVGAAFFEGVHQPRRTGFGDPFRAQAVALGKLFGEKPVTRLGESLRGEGVELVEPPEREADHPALQNGRPVVHGPVRDHGGRLLQFRRSTPGQQDSGRQESQHHRRGGRERTRGVCLQHRKHSAESPHPTA